MTEHGKVTVASDSNKEKVVVILGAGFSHALFARCPTTDELGEKIRSRLSRADRAKLPRGQFQDGRFEEWLSYLSEAQPHFTLDQVADAEALAVRVTRAMCAVLSDAQRQALGSKTPEWFWRFLSVLHVLRADVITLNYDNFVECGIQTLGLRVPVEFSTSTVIEDDILAGLPRCAEFPNRSKQSARGTTYDGHLVTSTERRTFTFKLLKLHGSLSWYWLPEGAGGATLRRWQLPGLFGQPWPDAEELRQQELPSHEVFVVPPAALKSQRLKEPVARELWRRAAKTLHQADRIVLIGYSLPLADHSISGMLADGLQERQVPVEIVNPDPKVQDRLDRLGVGSADVRHFDEENCIADWTDAEIARLSARAVQALRCDTRLEGEVLMFPSGGREGRFRTLAAPDGPSGPVVLRLNQKGRQLMRPVMFDQLKPLLQKASSCVIEDGKKRLPVIGHWVREASSGAMMTQLHLVPAGQ